MQDTFLPYIRIVAATTLLQVIQAANALSDWGITDCWDGL